MQYAAGRAKHQGCGDDARKFASYTEAFKGEKRMYNHTT